MSVLEQAEVTDNLLGIAAYSTRGIGKVQACAQC